MKTPLFFWFVVCFICVFSSCEKGKCYYHSEVPCGKVYGNVKKVTDTIYSKINGDIMHPLQVNEYHFDSLKRLVEVQYCVYRIEKDEWGNELGISMSYRQISKYRYDRDGRKVESNSKNCRYQSDMIQTEEISERLVSLDGNIEKWEINIIDQDGDVLTGETYLQYEEDRIYIDIIDHDTQEEKRYVRVFDKHENQIEFRSVSEDGISTLCKYNKDNQLIQVTNKPFSISDEGERIYYEMDEFDNDNNWLKRTGFDENKEILHITRRRIEYRI